MLHFLADPRISPDTLALLPGSKPFARRIFLFPSNASHHVDGNTPYTPREGGGLAEVAGAIQRRGGGTLGLPTMLPYTENPRSERVVQAALKDLGRLVGFGGDDFDFVLPVRAFRSGGASGQTRYFPHRLFVSDREQEALAPACAEFFPLAAGGMEPNFWGLNADELNPILADYYSGFLRLLAYYLNGKEREKTWALEQLRESYPEFISGLKTGQKEKSAKETPAWYRPPQVSPTQSEASAQPIPVPAGAASRSVASSLTGASASSVTRQRTRSTVQEDILSPSYSYTVEDLGALFKAAGISTSVVYLDQPKIHQDRQVREQLERLINEIYLYENYSKLIPINIAEGEGVAAHWVFLLIEPNPSARAYGSIRYVDPLADSIDSEVIGAIPSELPDPIAECKRRLCEDNYGTGPWIVENAARLMGGLSIPGATTPELRAEHAARFPSEQQSHASTPAQMSPVVVAPKVTLAETEAQVEVKRELERLRAGYSGAPPAALCEIAVDANGWKIDLDAALKEAMLDQSLRPGATGERRPMALSRYEEVRAHVLGLIAREEKNQC